MPLLSLSKDVKFTVSMFKKNDGLPGVSIADSVGDAVAGADLIISLVAARAAVVVADGARERAQAGAIYVDLNSASPTRKQEVAEALGEGIKMVDGAVIGSVMRYGAKVNVLLAGAFVPIPPPYHASHWRGCRTNRRQGRRAPTQALAQCVYEGLGALITESMRAGETGESNGCVSRLPIPSWTANPRWTGCIRVQDSPHAVHLSLKTASRVAAACRCFHNWPVTRALDVHALGSRGQTDLATELAKCRQLQWAMAATAWDWWTLPSNAWPSSPIAGRHSPSILAKAITRLHRALKQVTPGDILVVSVADSLSVRSWVIDQRAQALESWNDYRWCSAR